MRTAALVERVAADGGRTTVVIDTGPDFREQMLLASVKRIDAVVYTHPHGERRPSASAVGGWCRRHRAAGG